MKHIVPVRKVAVKKPTCDGASYRRASPESTRVLASFIFSLFCAVFGLVLRSSGGGRSARCIGGTVVAAFDVAFWPILTGVLADLVGLEENSERSERDRRRFVQ